MARAASAVEATIATNVEAIDVRTGKMIGIFLEDTRLQVVAPDRVNVGGVTVTEFDVDAIVLAGPVVGKVAGRRGAWAITRTVEIDDPQWGAVAPAWSWLVVPDDWKESRASSERFLADLRGVLPKGPWAKRIKLSKDVRRGTVDPHGELLALARRRSPSFVTACSAVDEERARRAARIAEQAERVLLDSLRWRGEPEATTAAP
jgi:hypothetical protein